MLKIYYLIHSLVFILIVTLVIVSTIYSGKSDEEEKQSLKKELLFCFSARRNINNIFKVSYKHRGLDCLYILRAFSIFTIIMGHRHIQELHVGNVTGRLFEWVSSIFQYFCNYNKTLIIELFNEK